MEEPRTRLKRKIDQFLIDWKANPGHKPLIVKGARQVGKTEAIRHFADNNYTNTVEINFVLNKEFTNIFNNGFEVDTILREISLLRPAAEFIPGKTLIFFDELQDCINAATSLKAFREDGRYDVICSGSMMGINYKEIESNSVGNKQDYEMYSLDFEEFLWGKGYRQEQIEDLYRCMLEVRPLSELELNVMFENLREYMVVGGMPEVVWGFVQKKTYEGVLAMQRQILLDYEEDITKYTEGLEQARVLNAYHKVPVFLSNENKKFQVTKIEANARNREYIGVVDWLARAGVVNVSYCMERPVLPLKGNYNPDNYRVYFADTGLLIGSLDEEAQDDLRKNKNYNTYKGALYENIMAEALRKQGYGLFFYKNEKSTVEMDFIVRDSDSLVPVEVKATDGATASLNNMIKSDSYPDTHYGVKFAMKNIGFNGKFYTFPYFMAFMLRRFLAERGSVQSEGGAQ